MKNIVTGIIAHVDAGKTTLSEAMLYQAGALRKLGRVDNHDSFLDPNELEKQRAITIFSHQANLTYENLNLTILDTPGHIDFAAQTEQVLSVLDYAILVISKTDGIKGYTRNLWNLLAKYNVPVFIFVNKMDAVGGTKAEFLSQIKANLSEDCIDFNSDKNEEIAMLDEELLESYLESGNIEVEKIREMIKTRQVFPCYFGSALKLEGVETFMQEIANWTDKMQTNDNFGARVFKISYDQNGERLTWIRLTGGNLHPKDVLVNEQKINQIRKYNGNKFSVESEITTGEVCALTGLTDTYVGMGIGKESDSEAPIMQPVLSYAIDPKDNDVQVCLGALKKLEDETPQLHVLWVKHLQEIQVQLMGTIQAEILQQILLDRFGLAIEFGESHVMYKETITDSIEGVGHFEPLRHYSEVHLLMEPLPLGSGLVFDNECSLEVLYRNWQHQVLANLKAKEHLGVLIGAPITDIKITLVSGRSHLKHTEGGDFKEATWRAVRQGLMMLKQTDNCRLLEPWYRFRLSVGQDQVGRAMSDVQMMQGKLDPETIIENDLATLTGIAPVAKMQDYAQKVSAYTHGSGQLECILEGYFPCQDQVKIVANQQYNPVADLENTPDSVFCAHGAGYPVAWHEVPKVAHVPYLRRE